MSPEYQVDIPQEKAAEFAEMVKSLGGKMRTRETEKFLQEFTFDINDDEFPIPKLIVDHYSISPGDTILCQLVQVRGGASGRTRMGGKKLLVEAHRDRSYYYEFTKEESGYIQGTIVDEQTRVDLGDLVAGYGGVGQLRIIRVIKSPNVKAGQVKKGSSVERKTGV